MSLSPSPSNNTNVMSLFYQSHCEYHPKFSQYVPVFSTTLHPFPYFLYGTSVTNGVKNSPPILTALTSRRLIIQLYHFLCFRNRSSALRLLDRNTHPIAVLRENSISEKFVKQSLILRIPT